MPLPRFLAMISVIVLLVPDMRTACGQTTPPGTVQVYPNKPVRIVTTDPGGGNDFQARLIAQGLSAASLGQQAIVENRGGGGGMIAAETVAKASPDGYTVILHGSTIWLLPFLRSGVPWDVAKDFSPLLLVSTQPNVLVVHPSLPVKSVNELIVLARARPGELNDGAAGSGSSSHLSAELFKAMAGVKIVRVNYKGVAPAMSALIGGEIQLIFPTVAGALPHIKSGRLKALALTSASPSALFPGLTTMAASGLPGYESVTMTGMFAPARTPATIIGRLNQEIVQLLNRADSRERFLNAGAEVVASSSEQFAATIKTEMAKWSKIIKDAGIRAE